MHTNKIFVPIKESYTQSFCQLLLENSFKNNYVKLTKVPVNAPAEKKVKLVWLIIKKGL